MNGLLTIQLIWLIWQGDYGASMAAKKKDPEPEDKDAEGKPEGEAGEGVDLPKKKIAGKKLILIIVVAVIVLLGGGGAALYFSGILGGKGEEHAEAGADAHGEGHGEEAANTAPVYVELPNMLVNLSTSGRTPMFMRVRVSLVLQKEEDRVKVTESQPRIIDSFQTYIRELAPEDIQGSVGLLRLKEELLVRVNAAVAPVVVKDLLFIELVPGR
jgi:flagellar FliL protein